MDQAAFKAFYQNTAPRLRGYIAQSCGSREAVDDILQEVFLKFLRVPEKKDERSMRAYLYRTANSIIIDNWRRRKREMAWSLEATTRDSTSWLWDTDDEVKKAFSELNVQQRSLLWLAYVEGFDHREIAAAVGVKEKSVRVLLFRARKALAGLLEEARVGPEVA